MREIQSGQVKLSNLADLTQEGKFDGYDISSILKTHETNFTSELEISSQTFGTILQEIIQDKEPAEDLIGMSHRGAAVNGSFQGHLLATNIRHNA
jgi:hypothetical protein